MERYRGHFFNWYDTQSLTPLHPQYVSTVDSQIWLATAVAGKRSDGMKEARLLPSDDWRLRDTLRVLLDVSRRWKNPFLCGGCCERLSGTSADKRGKLGAAHELLDRLTL
jgi:hypothetical protein